MLYDIYEKISDYLNYNDIINFTSTNKLHHQFSNNFFWKRRLYIDFGILQLNLVKHKPPFEKYKYIMNFMCKKCLTHSSNINYFFKERVCKSCENSTSQYKTITRSDALTYYYVCKKGLENLRCKMIPSGDRFYNIYLLSDVIKLRNKRFPTPSLLNAHISKITNNKVLKNIQYLTKWSILKTVLEYHNIRVENYNIYIERYTGNLQKKYFRTNDSDLFENLVNKYMELDFIYNWVSMDIYTWVHLDLDTIISKILLTNKDSENSSMINSLSIDKKYFILNKILNIMASKKFITKYMRKNLLISKFGDLKYCLTDRPIYDYISNNTGCIEKIKNYVIEENFMMVNISNDRIGMFINDKPKFILYKEKKIIL